AGYQLLTTLDADATTFTDDNNGDGLVVGQNYNYIVTAFYEDGSESSAGAGVCAELKQDVPVMLNVDVKTTSSTGGKIFVRWTRPVTGGDDLDTIVFPGPYTFRLLHRVQGGSGGGEAVFTTRSAERRVGHDWRTMLALSPQLSPQ